MAKPLPHYIDVDLKKDTQYHVPLVTQNDTDVVFVLRVTDGGRSDATVLDDFTTITLTSKRKDKKSFYVTGVKIPGTNEVEFNLGTSELEIADRVNASAQFYSGEGRQSSAHFNYEVEKDLTGEYIPSENEASLIETVLVDGPRIMAEAEAATLSAIQAMNDLTGQVNGALDTLQSDKEAALAEMAAATELANSAAENADTERLQLTTEVNGKIEEIEAVRVATVEVKDATQDVQDATEAERLLTKAEREATSTVREETEVVRDATETVRSNTLAVRQATETVRANTEAERLATESVRASTVTARNETITATTNAVTATTNANTAAGNANTAAGRADTSAGNADVATGRANAAADAVEDALENGPVISVNGQNGVIVVDAASIGVDTSEQSNAKDAAVLQSARDYADGLEPDLTGYETETGAQAKADAALSAAKTYADGLEPDLTGYETTADVNSKIGTAITESKTYTDTTVAALVDSSPETMNTLNELAAALGDDPNFATTVSNQIGTKVDKVAGKGLSTNDYTTAEKTKLSGIATGANNYSHPATHPASMITEDATHRFATDTQITFWNGASRFSGNYADLSGLPSLFNGDYNNLLNKPSIPAAVTLNNTVTSTSTTQAATANSVKTAYDRAQAAFQSASDGKTLIANAVTGKGVAASEGDAFGVLAGKIGQIPSGRKSASGIGANPAGYNFVVRGLDFKPSIVIATDTTFNQPVDRFSFYGKVHGSVVAKNIQIEGGARTGLAIIGDCTLFEDGFSIKVLSVSTVSWVAFE